MTFPYSLADVGGMCPDAPVVVVVVSCISVVIPVTVVIVVVMIPVVMISVVVVPVVWTPGIPVRRVITPVPG